eukprot:m.27969 g.27969  ORF g.27969 m.27969 type:complete len:622 (+) comp4482_c0_seq1:47-1912(+)
MEEMIGASAPEPRPVFSLPSVLHYLQREWSRFEHDRAKWAQEKAELQARIGFLEGQYKAEEALKRDLLRRIKMLEFALKQERMKSLPPELREDAKPPFVKDAAAAQAEETKLAVREGREILTQYLAEMGFTDAVIHAQAQRMKTMLESWPPLGASDVVSKTFYAPEASLQSSLAEERVLVSDSQAPMQTIDIVAPENDALSSLDDMLMSMDSETQADSFEPLAPAAPVELPDLESLEKTMGQRFGSAGVRVLTRAMKGADKGAKPDAADVKADLGDLADFSIINENPKTQAPATSSVAMKTWSTKFTLRSHFDGVRALAWVGTDLTLLSASEDHTVKLWHLPQSSKKTNFDVEAAWTYRGHTQPVYAVAVSHTNDACFSAGADLDIFSWRVVPQDVDKFCAYSSYAAGRLSGHTDVVWSLVAHPSASLLLSASADGTCRLWDAANSKQLFSVSHPASKAASPTCVDFLRSDTSKFLASFDDGTTHVFDVSTGKAVMTFQQAPIDDGAVFALATHATLNAAVTGHQDKHMRYYDTLSGEVVYSTVAHEDIITSVDFDPNGLHLVSAGHDRSIRFWEFSTRRCITEFTAHRRKADEAIHALRFHPSLPYLASAGADSIVRVHS